MKRLMLTLALATLTASAAAAGGMSFDLPHLDFGTASADVTQLCNPLTQACGN